MKNRIPLLLALFLTIGDFCSASGTIKTACWSVNELTYTLSKEPENPFELDLGAIFTHSSGKSLNVPGFYNGGKNWMIRFSLDLSGEWEYITWSSEPKLAGKKGIIQVDSNKNSRMHGPLIISSGNSQKFQYADGTPYFLMAFEIDWLFALDAQNTNDIPRTRMIVDEMAKNKFNHAVMNVYAYDADWGEREKIRPEFNFAQSEIFPFGGSNHNPDYSQLNIGFFKHLDRVIAYLGEKEIIAHLMIYVWNKKVNWPESDSKSDNLYFDYIIKRYQAYTNILWDISKEALAYGHDDMDYITRRIDRLRKLDAHQRLLTVHDYSYCAAFPEKVDIISIQEWKPNLYNEMLYLLKKYPKKPIFNIEHGGYEKTMHSIFNGAYSDPIVCLDRNYQCYFAGSYSTYYWQNTSWYEVVYDLSKIQPHQKPNFNFYKNIAELFSRYDFSQLEPTQHFFSSFCLTNNKNLYMYYLPSGMDILHGEVKDLKGKQTTITWFDVTSGIFYEGGSKDFTNTSWLGIKRPDSVTSPMAVVIIEVKQGN